MDGRSGRTLPEAGDGGAAARGEAALRAGRWPEAASAFEAALAQGEGTAAVWFGYGRALAESGAAAAAARAFGQARRLDSGGEAAQDLAAPPVAALPAAAEASSPADVIAEPATGARAACEAALRRDPGAARTWALYAQALAAEGALTAAAGALRRARSLAPADAEIGRQLVQLLARLGRPAPEADPVEPAGGRASAQARGAGPAEGTERGAGPTLAAEARARRDAALRAGDAANRARRWLEAAASYGEALECDPSLAHIWVQYGHALKESGAPEQAVEAYGRAIALAPATADSHLHLGHVLKRLGRLDAARDAYAAALVADPDLLDAADELQGLAQAAAEEAAQRGVPPEAAAEPDRPAEDPRARLLAEATLPDGGQVMVRLASDRRRLVVDLRRPRAEGPPPVLHLTRDGAAVEPFAFAEVRGTAEHLRAESLCLLGDGAPAHLRLACAGRVLLDRGFPTQPAVIGSLDRFSGGVLRGWAIDFRQPREPAEIEILVNGVLSGIGPADLPRADVATLFPGHPRTGFALPFDPEDHPPGPLAVAARVAGEAEDLRARLGPIARGPAAAGPTSADQRRFGAWEAPGVTVIVPVYNAPEETEACILSLLATLPLAAGRTRILLSDDCSPDPRVAALLDRYADRPGLAILRHPQNLGYTRNINAAIARVPEGDIVLLNSDAEVTPRWLERLQRAAYRNPLIGTATPVSDNAGAFSVPDMNRKNAVPPWLDRDAYARLVAQASAKLHQPVPTGSGFCLYVKRALLDAIGPFDAESFPRGYGEENDFCMRAGHAGWQHVVAEDVLVYHARSASFGESRTALLAHAGTVIPERYPEYATAIRHAFHSPALNRARVRLRNAALRGEGLPRPRVLYVLGVESGGTPQTNLDLMAAVDPVFAPFLLLCMTESVRLFEMAGRRRILREEIRLNEPVALPAHDSIDYAEVVTHLLQAYEIELVHVRHIGRHGLSLIGAARRLDIPVLFSIHDFYTLCPNTKLLDAQDRYCAGRCTEGLEPDCRVDLWRQDSAPPLKHRWIGAWQARLKTLLQACDGLITTSEHARATMRAVYGLAGVPFDVIPHGRDFEAAHRHAAAPEPGEPLRVLVPGNLSTAKGLGVIRAVKALDRDGAIAFHFLGATAEPVADIGTAHGPYQREDFHRHVAAIRPHVGLVLSLWPETYCHTLTELWSCGVPALVSPLGALGERMERHGGGWTVEPEPEAVLARLLALRGAPEAVAAARERVFAWQAGYGRAYGVDAMARFYLSRYREVLRRRIDPAASAAPVWVLALADADDRVGAMPSAHIEPAVSHLLGRPAEDIGRMPGAVLAILDELPPPAAIVLRHSGPVSDPDGLARLLARTDRPFRLVADLDPSLPADDPWGARLRAACDATVASDAVPLDGASVHRTSRGNDLRLDVEVRAGASALVGPRNRRAVDAHFETIDWDALLARAPNRAGVSVIVRAPADPEALTRLIGSLTLPGSIVPEEFVLACTTGRALPPELTGGAVPVRRIAVSPDLGPVAALNRAAARARGRDLVFLDGALEAVSAASLADLVGPLEEGAAGLVQGTGPGDPGPLCLALRAADWIKLRGFSPVFVASLADVDLARRVQETLRRGVQRLDRDGLFRANAPGPVPDPADAQALAVLGRRPVDGAR